MDLILLLMEEKKCIPWSKGYNVKDFDISLRDALVYGVIYSHNNKVEGCWPSIELISKESGLAKRLVIESIQALEKVNLLTVKQQMPYY